MISNKLMKGIGESLLMGLFLTAIISVAGLDFHLPPPEYDSLEMFHGSVTDISHNEKTKRWYVKAANGNELRKFFIPQSLCGKLSDKLKIGSKIETKLYRRFWYFGDIRGWEVNSGQKSIVSFNESNAMQLGDLQDLSKTAVIAFVGISIGWGLMVYSRTKKRNNA